MNHLILSISHKKTALKLLYYCSTTALKETYVKLL